MTIWNIWFSGRWSVYLFAIHVAVRWIILGMTKYIISPSISMIMICIGVDTSQNVPYSKLKSERQFAVRVDIALKVAPA